MARFFHWGHGGFGHGRFGRGFHHRWHGAGRWFPHHGEPGRPDADGDNDGDGDSGPPPKPPFPFPLPPLPFLEVGEAEAEHHYDPRHRHSRYRNDQEVGEDDEPPEDRGENALHVRRSGRWVRTEGKLILFGV